MEENPIDRVMPVEEGKNQPEVEEVKDQVFLECSLNYSMLDKSGNEIEKDSAKVKLEKEKFSITPDSHQSFVIPYREILNVFTEDYKISLTLTSNNLLVFSNLGFKFEDFQRTINDLRNEIVLKDMLMSESLKNPETISDFVYSDEKGEKRKGKAKLRLYETGLVIIPDYAEPIRIPYSYISEFNFEDYSVLIITEFAENVVLSKMGSQFDFFKRDFSAIISELSLKTQNSFKELLPDLDALTLRKVSGLLKDGKAVKKNDLEKISKNVWEELETKIKNSDAYEEYEFLKSLSNGENLYIGIKRDLLGDLTGEYIWFLIPIYNANPSLPGNAIAMETIEGESSKATYFFKIISRANYSNTEKFEEMNKQIDKLVQKINRSMLSINFRREPIYLSEKKLKEPQYQKYVYSIHRLPELRDLRGLFIGRVAHSSKEQWKKDVTDLLEFNVKSNDDNEKWKGEN